MKRSRLQSRVALSLLTGLLASPCLAQIKGIHHMKFQLPLSRKQANNTRFTPLLITNSCPDTVWPAITTQYGDGPPVTGFELAPGENSTQWVSEDWQGRVWARTNCSFNNEGTGPAVTGGYNGGGQACGTGDCNGILECRVTGLTPVTLAEFTLDAGDGHTYYDISLVDGYNLPMAIVLMALNNYTLEEIPPNLTNPACVATVSDLAAQDFNPYHSPDQVFLGTNSAYPLDFERKVTDQDVSRWCPWNLQQNPPEKPGDGVYPYPDDTIQRPIFNPCYSACAKWNKPADCCTGEHSKPSTCQPSEYSKASKAVCPDAYSYAFDDISSTFIIPAGGGFQIVFCPGGRSSDILANNHDEIQMLVQTGHVDPRNSKTSYNGGNSREEATPYPTSGAPGGFSVLSLGLCFSILTAAVSFQLF